MEINILIDEIEEANDCIVNPPLGLPLIPDKYLVLPTDLAIFYARCGGMVLFSSEDFWIEIVSPADFVNSNLLIRNEKNDDDISESWFRVARQDLQENISIDLNPVRLGRCYDSFWDRHAIPGECPIIAYSFTELLSRLFEQKGKHWYWLGSDSNTYKDAYDG